MALAVAWASWSSHSMPRLGTSMCHRCGPKEQKKQKGRQCVHLTLAPRSLTRGPRGPLRAHWPNHLPLHWSHPGPASRSSSPSREAPTPPRYLRRVGQESRHLSLCVSSSRALLQTSSHPGSSRSACFNALHSTHGCLTLALFVFVCLLWGISPRKQGQSF